MNTVFEVYAAHADARYAAQAAQAAFALVDRLEGELSRFRPNSDITRINHLTAGESARVGEAALECLLIARHLYDLTDGAFDVAIGTGLAVARDRCRRLPDPRDGRTASASISAASARATRWI